LNSTGGKEASISSPISGIVDAKNATLNPTIRKRKGMRESGEGEERNIQK
jgi:hypothetical protein